MIKKIVKDEYFLVKKSYKFVFGEDDHIITDLIDTANAHKGICSGLAAVQIGYYKRAIVVKIKDNFIPFINPVIVKRSVDTYATVEGCLSLEGQRDVRRHKYIVVRFTNRNGKTDTRTYSGYVAQIIQHECDHLDGILI